jgi:hypothetical protein
MDRVQIVATIAGLILLVVIVELVRRHALEEGHSLLWMLTGACILVLALNRWLLAGLARLVGIYYPPTALLVIASGFFLLILLQFSTLISKLTRQNKDLIHSLAILDWRVREMERELRRLGGKIPPEASLGAPTGSVEAPPASRQTEASSSTGSESTP